ncbi:MAG: ATP phosphoribosyltransferase [Thermoanaerobaculum sp.]|nr:ATP phosphoribosyltransferase [Thermoanaerobaculum sp.]MDW7967814.1 ATP phosphoribosyltransferase [Thermoanaerobaculum sp.]
MLTLALPKGRLLQPVLDLLQASGISLAAEAAQNSRRLVFADHQWRLVLTKDADVPAYVSQGVADAGFVGLDHILESGVDLLRVYRLPFGHCSLCLLARAGVPLPSLAKPFRLATKYPRLGQKLVSQRGLWAEVIPLAGSVELAATLELAPFVLDLVETGRTLRENDLVIVERWLQVAPYFVVNRASWVTRGSEVRTLMHGLGGGYENRAFV